MIRYFISIRTLLLFLILLFVSCEELEIDAESVFEAETSEQLPDINTLYESVTGSSVVFTWIANDFALEFSYKLEYNLTNSENIVAQSYYNWSDWTTLKEITFTNLDDGEYTFYVKSRFDLIEEEVSTSTSFQINNIPGPALRVYPLNQLSYSGDSINVYLYMEVVDTSTVKPINLLQVDLEFSVLGGSFASVELDGDVENLSSSLYCSADNDNPLNIFTTSSQSDAGVFSMRIIQSYLDDNGLGLCNTGSLVRIPLKVLASDGVIAINISAGQFKYYNSANDTFQDIEFNSHNGIVTVEGQ